MAGLSVVTGAFGYTGTAIARRLLAGRYRVRTLTNHPSNVNPFGEPIEIAPLAFEDPDALCRSLTGCDALYNTYWVRFNHGHTSFDRAVRNSIALIHAAEQAGVRRIVHLSITNPSLVSLLPYFRGKALVEEAIRKSRLSYAILRPTVIFGLGDILINNIAWLLRKAPVFAIPGDGSYRLQPVFVEDVAELACAAAQEQGSSVCDAAGPEVFTYEELVRLLAVKIRSRSRIVHFSPSTVLRLGRVLGLLVRDEVLTREEIDGLMAGLLVSQEAPRGQTRFSDWLRANGSTLGQIYASELARHFR